MTDTSKRPSRANPAQTLMQIRQLHVYLGMLIAPSVLFFCVTGFLQIYNFHEDHGGYHAPMLLEKLGRVHKDQVFAEDHKGPPPGPRPATAAKAGPPEQRPPGPDRPHKGPAPATVLLKAFFAVVAGGLFVSTAMGIWMALKYNRRALTCGILLCLGVVLPLVLAALTAG